MLLRDPTFLEPVNPLQRHQFRVLSQGKQELEKGELLLLLTGSFIHSFTHPATISEHLLYSLHCASPGDTIEINQERELEEQT